MPASLRHPLRHARTHSPAREPDGWLLLLAECEGYLVDTSDGREVGVVEEVELAETGDPVALKVAGGHFGGTLLRLEADAVEVLMPAEQRLVVEPERVPAADEAQRA